MTPFKRLILQRVKEYPGIGAAGVARLFWAKEMREAAHSTTRNAYKRLAGRHLTQLSRDGFVFAISPPFGGSFEYHLTKKGIEAVMESV
jgi:hypothetical protein